MIDALCLHSQMRAWLRLIPKGERTTNAARFGRRYPPIPHEWRHLPVWLDELGNAGHAFGERLPLTFTEIQAWATCTGIRLQAFEARALREMSDAFAWTINNPDAPCPIDSEEIGEQMDAAAIASWLAVASHD